MSVVIPALNEAVALPRLLAALRAVLDRIPGDHEIIVVNDGSRDGSEAVLADLRHVIAGLSVVTHPVTRGYGAAQRSGFERARGDWIWVLPGDGQIDPAELPRYLEASHGVDVVAGYYRARADSPLRRWLSRIYLLVIRLRFGLPLRAVNAPKLYRREVLADIHSTVDSGAADAEIVLTAWLAGRRFAQVGINCRSRHGGRSSINLHSALRSMREFASVMRKVARAHPAAGSGQRRGESASGR